MATSSGGPVIFSGFGRGLHPINQLSTQLWDAHNIRLTAREGESFNSLTNEKSTLKLLNLDRDGYTTHYIGHHVCGIYLILFIHYVTSNSSIDVIYRVDLSQDQLSWSPIILYQGTLGFDPQHPAQIIFDYEANLIQKIYWVDGVNRPRLMNIVKPELKDAEYDESTGYSDVYTDAPFDFVQDMTLDESCSVVRQNSTSGGVFSAGAIQYVLTYSFKYGQETNPFYTSEILYTSYSDRGGNSEDTVNNAFKITVEDPETKFDYLNIYSVLRTALNGTPTVKRVVRIDLSNVTDNTVSFVDTNTTGETVDESYLLFSNRDIIADNIFNKDGTLFLGNLTYLRQNVKDVVGEDVIRSILHNAFTMHRVVSFDVDNQNTNYLYVNQLSQNTSYFRANETYRLGVQFQYKTGEWSEPIWLEDYTVDSDEGRPYFTSGSQFNLYLSQIAVDWDSDVDSDYGYLGSLIEAGYINVRPVVVLPETYERTVLTQGLVSSTVFQVGARSNNTPHSFASWMFRPMGEDPSIDENVEDKGAVVEWRHLHPLVSGKSSAAEIQNMAFAEDAETGYDEESKRRVLKDYEWWQDIIGTSSSLLFNDPDLCVNYFGLNTIKAALDDDIESVNNIWYVDQSICTLHSPDIEFNSAISSLLDSEPDISMQVSGIVTFNNTLSALDIDLSTVQADPDSTGEKSRTFSSNRGNGLVSFLGFNDGLIDDFKDNGGSLLLSEYNDTSSKHGSRNWLTHLWHRTGSLNNDAVRPSTDTGTRTAEIQTKKISNLRIANYTYWLKNAAALSLAVRDITVFDSDEISLVKLQDDYNDLGDIIYFGNVDVLNPTYTAFKLVYGTGTKEVVSDDEEDEDSDSSSSASTVYFVGSVYLRSKVSSSAVPILEEQTIPIAVTSTLLHSNDKITITGTIDQESINYTTPNVLRTGIKTLYGVTTELYGEEITFIFNGSQWEATTVTVDGDTFVFTPSVISYDADGANYITADNIIADNVLGTSIVEVLGYLTPDQDSSNNGNTENDDEVETGSYLGDYYTAVFAPKDGVRIKYKSTPHGVFDFQYKNFQYDNITTLTHLSMPVLEGIETLDDEDNYYDVEATAVTYNDNNITRATQFWLITADSDADYSIVTYNYTFNTTAFVNDYPSSIKSYLWLCEIMQEDVENRFGGDSYEALLNNTWLPAGPAVSLESIKDTNKAKASINSSSSITEGYEEGNIWWQWGDTWYQRYDCLKTYPYSTEDVNQLVEIGSFFVETNVNIDGRYDRNRGLVDNTNISPTNFNLINDVYTQKNNFFTYTILDDDYYKTVKYPAQFIWSGVKTPGATTDEWARTHLASSVDLDGSKGNLTAITCFADTVIGLQEKAMQRINFNPRALVDAGEGVSGVPIEIAQSLKVDGFNKLHDVGCQDKFSVLNTPNALYFVDHNNYILYSFDTKNGLVPLSENSGIRYWLKNNHSTMSWMLRADDDYSDSTNGIRIFYDSKYQDIYLTPGAQLLSSDDSYFYPESLVFSEQLSRFTSLMSYGGSAMFEYEGRQYALAYSLDDDSFNIYEMHSEDINSYNTIFDKVFPFSFSFIFNGDSPGTAKHMENIELRADCYDYTDSDGNSLDRIELQGGDYNIAKQDGIPFDFIRVRNEYQDTGIQYFNTLKDGVVALQTPTLRKKFRVWRAQIPRGTEGKNYRGQASRERIYNTWSEITLGKENPGTSMTILHNLNVTGGGNKQE